MLQNKYFVGLSLLAGIAIIDDNRLTLDEGFSIILIQLLGIMLFDELSLLL